MNRHAQVPQRGTFWLQIPFLATVFAIASSPSQANTFGTLYISTNTTLTNNRG